MKVALIGCSATKLQRPAPARELYTGQLFRAALRYAEPRFEHVFVLSAWHGLVPLAQQLEPYEGALSGLTAEERCWWAHEVLLELGAALGVTDEHPLEIHVLAGATYAEPLLQQLPEWPAWTLVRPLKGLGIGKQKAWLAREAA